MLSWKFKAVVIRTPPNEQNRLYVDETGRPMLWSEHHRGADEVAKVLTANGLKVEAVNVTISTEKPPAV